LTWLKTSFPTWHTICWWFQKKTFTYGSNSDRSAGTSLCVPEEVLEGDYWLK
jgi:hypothetical protein